MKSSVAGEAQLLPDIDGAGLSAKTTITAPVAGGGQVTHLRFTIPAGRLLAFIFAPLDRAGEVSVERCWITAESGQVLAVIPPAALRRYDSPGGPARADGTLHLSAREGETITGLQFEPKPPIDLTLEPPPQPEQLVGVFIGSLIVSVAISILLGGRFAAWLRILEPLAATLARAPRRALFAMALVAVSLACFPVIFQGKSFVSPDNGMQLLYTSFPTVPGAQGGRMENAMGSDMGATHYWHMPVSVIQARAIFTDHELPLWNRYTSGGVALLGQGISMLGDPLHWVTIAAGGASWSWDVKYVVALFSYSFAVGLLVWRTAGSLPVALALTLSAPFMGFFAYRFCHAGFFALCYAPWILVAWVEGARAPTLRRAAPWAGLLIFANWLQLNSGTAKEASAFLVFLNAAGGLGLLFARESVGWRAARLGLFAWATVLFLLLSAPLWMTFLDALGKAYTVYDRQQICQLQPGLAIGLFDDIFQRQLMKMEFLFSPSTNFFVLLGVLWAAVRMRTLLREPWFLAAVLVAVAAAAIVFGVVPPAVLGALPMIKTIYHFDNTFSGVLFILFFVIAGCGLREALARIERAEWTGDWAVVLALTGLLFASFLGMTEASHRVGITFIKMGQPIAKSPFFWGYTASLFAALALLPWAVRAGLRRREGALAWLGVALVAFSALHFRHGMWGETRFDLYTRNPKPRLDLRHLASPALARVDAELASEPGRVLGLDWEVVPGYTTMLGLETISGPDALMDPAYLELTKILGLPRIWDWRVMIWPDALPKVRRGLDLLNVRHFLDKPGQPDLPGTTMLGRDDLTVVQNDTAWPRAFFTDTVLPYASGSELRALVEQGDGRPFAAMSAADPARPALPVVAPAARTVVPAKNYRLTNNSTSFEIEAPSAGVAVLLETNSPGDIEVLVNGQPAECLTVDHAFRGVFIPSAGHYSVRFTYWPTVLTEALWIAGVGVILLLLGILWLRITRAAPAS